jgi:hypothetical protein
VDSRDFPESAPFHSLGIFCKTTWFPQSHALYGGSKYPHYTWGKSTGHEVTGYDNNKFQKEKMLENRNPSGFWLVGLKNGGNLPRQVITPSGFKSCT